MHITIWKTHYFDFEPAPEGTVVTDADVSAGRAIKLADGVFKLRVHRKAPDGETHTDRSQSEIEICDFLIFAELFPGGRWSEGWDQWMGSAPMNRASIVTYFTAQQMRQHGRPKHFTKLEVHDDGPREDVFRFAAQRYVDDKHLAADKFDEFLKSYLADKSDVAAFMRDYFEMKEAAK